MFKKKPVLQYESAIEVYPNNITQAKNHVPDWYKKIPKWKDDEIFNKENGFNHTVKQCLPFLDSLTSGYIISLPNDLYVKIDNGVPFFAWKDTKFPPMWRENIAHLNLVPAGHFPMEYAWQTGAAITVPLGYSMIITHPFNRYDLPFTTLTGIVDGGLVMNPVGNIPFFLKENFEGIIYQGTPIAQIIPFYQQNWLSKTTQGLVEKSKKHNDAGQNVINGWYKKTFWTRKKYN